MVPVADIVCNNFTPRVMRKFGLDYASLMALKSDIIALQLTGYGAPGPWTDFPAYGPSIEAVAGMNASIGEDGDEPVKLGSDVFADYASGRYAALAMIAALERRRATGKGSYIDVSMYESIVHLLGELASETSRSGRPHERLGNRDHHLAPQGIYPCLGENQWVAISVQNDEQWAAFRSELGYPELVDPTLDNLDGRRQFHQRIDVVIGEWTASRKKNNVAARLQSLGIPAGPVQDVQDLPVDPQLAHRQFFQMQHHREPILGYRAHPHMAVTAQAEGFRRALPKETRGDGGNNRRVLRRWLGLGTAEVRALENLGALLPPRRSPFEDITGVFGTGGEVDPCFAQRLGLTKSDRRDE